MNGISGNLSEYPSRVGVCCGENPDALDCLAMSMECKAYFDGTLEEQYEAIGQLPSDWNVSEIRCHNYCDHLSDKPAWCAFPKWVSIGICIGVGWLIISTIVIYCWVKRRNKQQPAEPFNPLDDF